MLKFIGKFSCYALCSALIVGAYLLYSFINTPINIKTNEEFVINKGATTWQVAKQLKARKIIKSARLFYYLAYFRKDASKIKAGEYLLEPHLTPVALLQKFVRWQVMQHSFTIIAGWPVRQVLHALHNQPKINKTLPACGMQELQQLLVPANASDSAGDLPGIEGMLWPDTYFYTAGTTDVDLLARAYNLMQQKLKVVWQNRAEHIYVHSPMEALTLASILEKETSLQQEYYAIAGVFNRRLQINMPLQADPTLIYAANQALDCKYYTNKIDMQIDSPYNSYKNFGLPPGPIAIPSLEALRAAVHPGAGDTLYFVADGKGGHVFSATLEDHNKAVLEYRHRQRGLADYESPT